MFKDLKKQFKDIQSRIEQSVQSGSGWQTQQQMPFFPSAHDMPQHTSPFHQSAQPTIAPVNCLQGEPASQDYAVFINDRPLFVYTSWQYDRESKYEIAWRPVSPISFAYFAIDGPVHVKVVYLNGLPHHPHRTVNTVAVRPLSHQIQVQTFPGGCSFTIDRPCNLSIEPAFSRLQPLHLFANPPETDIPSAHDSSVIYFGAGVHEVPGLTLAEGQTVYVAEGAVVYIKPKPPHECEGDIGLGHPCLKNGTLIEAKWTQNITVRGRGILCARRSLDQNQRAGLLVFQDIKNLKIEGVILRESSYWTLNVVHGENLHVDNVKIMGHYQNHDGIVVSASNALIENSFIHNADDSAEIKSWEPVLHDITFRNIVCWSDVGLSLGIPCEVTVDISNVRYENCTVIHSLDPISSRGPIGINLQGKGNVTNVVFENIVIEDMVGEKRPAIKLFCDHVWENMSYVDDSEREVHEDNGTISDVTLRNIQVWSTENPVLSFTGSSNKAMKNIKIENVNLLGNVIQPGDGRILAQNVEDVQIV